MDLTKLSSLFLSLASAPIYLYHGTNKKNLSSILSQGLIPNPKKRTWQDDPDAGYYSPSRQSLEGLYLTSNLVTAVGSAHRGGNKSSKDNPIVFIVEIHPNALYSDEDSISIDLPLVDNEFHLLNLYRRILNSEADEEISEIVDKKLHYLKEVKKNLHPDLIERVNYS